MSDKTESVIQTVSDVLQSASNSPSVAETVSAALEESSSITSILDGINTTSSESLSSASSVAEALSSQVTTTILEHAE